MAVVLRMKRTGRKNRPSYRISATDSRNPRDGRTLETLGHYDPASPRESLKLSLDVERAKYWLSQGAKPSDTVASILRLQGVVVHAPRKKRERPGRSKPTRAKAHRAERKQDLGERKAARRKGRLAARRAAAKAAAAAPAEGAS